MQKTIISHFLYTKRNSYFVTILYILFNWPSYLYLSIITATCGHIRTDAVYTLQPCSQCATGTTKQRCFRPFEAHKENPQIVRRRRMLNSKQVDAYTYAQYMFYYLLRIENKRRVWSVYKSLPPQIMQINQDELSSLYIYIYTHTFASV